MKLASRTFALAVIVGVAVGCAIGCAAGRAEPGGGAGVGGHAAGATGAAGTAAAGSTGRAGNTGTAGTPCGQPTVVETHWTISRDATGPAITCAQAGATSVQLFMDAAHTQFSCEAAMGMSTDFPPGTYTPRVLLLAGPNILSQGNLAQTTVPSCGVLDLRGVKFLVGATGSAGAGGTGTGGAGGGAGAAGTSGAAGGSGGATGTAGMGGTGPCNALPIFAMHSCAAPGACHDAKGTSAHFDMSSPGWEKLLVKEVPMSGGAAAGLGSVCTSTPPKPYLVAGSVPARGLFLEKLAGKPSCGQQMPLLTSYLDASEMDCVQRWANALTK